MGFFGTWILKNEDEKDEFKITFKNNNKTPKDSNFISQKDSEMTSPKESIFKKIINIKSTPEQIIKSTPEQIIKSAPEQIIKSAPEKISPNEPPEKIINIKSSQDASERLSNKFTIIKLTPDGEISSESDKIFPDLIHVYTDGSCIHNGKPNAKAGIGIYFGPNDPRNVSRPVQGKQTNNTAELSAIIIACNILQQEIKDKKRIVVYTDSEYAIKCFTSYGRKLHHKNFQSDKPIPNLELLKQGFTIFAENPNITLKHIRSHTGKNDEHSLGNEEADRLANQAIGINKEQKESNKIYLNVAYANKDDAKDLGAKWDKGKKKWYVNENYKNSQVLVEKFGS